MSFFHFCNKKIQQEQEKIWYTAFLKKHHTKYNTTWPSIETHETVEWDSYTEIKTTLRFVILKDKKTFECKVGDSVVWVDEDQLLFPSKGEK